MDDLLFSYADPSFRRLTQSIIRLIERTTGQPHLKRLYMDYRNLGSDGGDFFAEAVRRLELDVDIDPARLAAIPRTGPLVVVANHPYGVLDGLVISWLVQQARPDFLVLTNAVLLRAPEVRPHLLPVDFAETEEALQTNLATRAAARKHLDAGGCIVVFPAGAVSTAPDRLGLRPAVDGRWQPFTSQLIQRSRATVLPMFFAGQNSRLFQIASHLHSALRLSLIFKEVRDRIGTTLPVEIGEPIPFREIAHLSDRQDLADHLRAVTYDLGTGRPGSEPRRRRRLRLPLLRHRLGQPVRETRH